MTKNHYKNNLNAMAPAQKAELEAKFRQLNSFDNLKSETARNGSPSLKGCRENSEVWLHSGYNPEAEGEKWADKIELVKGKIVVIVGFGLGYHVESLAKKADTAENVQIIAIEPSTPLLKLALEKRDFSTLLKKPNFALVPATNEADIHNFFNQRIRIGHFKDVDFQFFYPLYNFLPAYSNTLEYLKSFINSSFIDRNTFVRFGYDWTLNSLKNIPALVKSTPVDKLKGAFKNIPAIIVAAGPSLDKNIHLLKEVKGKAIIMALGTSFRPVINNGVEPDFVFAVDAQKLNETLFENIDQGKYSSTNLLYSPELYHGVPPLFGENLFIGMSPYSLAWFEELFHEKPLAFKSGPSVANFAFDLLVKTEANPIIFIGQDLAFTGDRHHAKGTYAEMKSDLEKQSDHLYVESIDGEPVETNRAMHAMLTWYNKYISSMDSKSEIIDATEGGAKIEGTKIMPLDDVIKAYCQKNINLDDRLQNIKKTETESILSGDETRSLIDQTCEQCDLAAKLSKNGYLKSLDFQATIASGTYAGKKLQKQFDDILQAAKEIDNQALFKKITSLMFQVVNRVFDEGRAMALREESFTREQGLAVAKAYQYYFNQVEEMADIAKGMLLDTAIYQKLESKPNEQKISRSA